MAELKEGFTMLYKYNALTDLITDKKEIDECIENLKVTSNFFDCIELCIFEINTESQFKPFLRFLLQKDIKEELRFFKLNGLQLLLNTKTFLELIEEQMHLILNKNENENIKYTFNGLYNYDNKIYLFIDITQMKLVLNDIYRTNDKWFVLIDEIINIKSVCDMDIQSNVTYFFISNQKFLFIQDEKNENIENPIVVYVGKEEKQLEFTHVFGQIKTKHFLESFMEKEKEEQNLIIQTHENMLGPYYYFTDFYNAIKQGGWSKYERPEEKYGVLITENNYGKYKKGGIVRIALFVGNMLIKINDPDDPIDESEIKKSLLNNPNLNTKYECLTMRITDYDGLWTNEYDSVYLGRIELDDGSIYKESYIYIVKDFIRQYPLSYHYIDKRKLGEKYDSDSEYSIM